MNWHTEIHLVRQGSPLYKRALKRGVVFQIIGILTAAFVYLTTIFLPAPSITQQWYLVFGFLLPMWCLVWSQFYGIWVVLVDAIWVFLSHLKTPIALHLRFIEVWEIFSAYFVIMVLSWIIAIVISIGLLVLEIIFVVSSEWLRTVH